jgi:predicted Zn-dependent protease with MMP-like domain
MRIEPERFEKLVFDAADEVLEQLPPHLRRDAEQVILEIEQWPTDEQMQPIDGLPGGTLLGLYQGIPLVQRHANTILLVPDRITLFQGPLQAGARTESELKRQVLRTLIHELAHFFGRTDEELIERDRY